jgi:hypothetical protein
LAENVHYKQEFVSLFTELNFKHEHAYEKEEVKPYNYDGETKGSVEKHGANGNGVETKVYVEETIEQVVVDALNHR